MRGATSMIMEGWHMSWNKLMSEDGHEAFRMYQIGVKAKQALLKKP
jgi:hypothetical protein